MKGVARQVAALDRLSQALLAVVVVLGLLVIRREFFPDVFQRTGPVPSAYMLSGWKVARDAGLLVGSSDAQVQIVEFVDIECPACREMHGTLEKLLRRFEGQVSLSLVHFPLPYHGNAEPGALALECAADQGTTAAMARALFEDQAGLGIRSWLDYAAQAGVPNLDRFGSCLADPGRRDAIAEGVRIGRELGVGYTPTLVVDGWVFEHAPNARLLERTVARLVRGIPPGPDDAVVSRIPGQSDAAVINIDSVALSSASAWTVANRPDWVVSDALVVGIASSGGPPRGVLLSDGRLALLSPFEAKIDIIDATGKVERSLGRRGEGPTEFGVVLDLVPVGVDSLALLDVGNARIAIVGVAKGTIATIPLPPGISSGLSRVAGRVSNRGYLLHGFGRLREGSPKGRIRPLAPWGIAGPDGSWVPWQELRDAETELLETRYGGHPEREPVEVRWGPRSVVAVSDDLVHTVESGLPEIVTRNPEGRILRRVRIAIPRRPVTRQMRDAVIAGRLEELARLTEPVFDLDESRRVIRETPFADSLRAIDRMLVAPDKTIWLLPVVAPGDSSWRAIGIRPDGSVTGSVGGPASIVPVAFGHGGMVGVIEGDDGGTLLGRWQFVRP